MSDKALRFVVPSILALFCLLIYIQTLSYQFLSLDDHNHLKNNPFLNPFSFENFLAIWSQSYRHLYIPLTYTVWGILKTIFGLDPLVFHLVNVILHGICTFYVYRILILLEFGRIPSAVAAICFLVHPVQVESVAWISGLKDLLFASLGLASMYLYLASLSSRSFDSKHNPDSRLRFVAAIVLFLLSLFSKPTAVVIPGILLILLTIHFRKTFSFAIKDLLPWFALVFPFVIVVWSVQATPSLLFEVPLAHRIPVALDAIAFYVGRVLFPLELAPDYGRSPAHVINSSFVWVTCTFTILLILFVWMIRKRLPELWVASLIFLVAILPVLGLKPFVFQTWSTVADRYLYLAFFGIAYGLAAYLDRRILSRFPGDSFEPKALWAIAAGTIILWSTLSFRQVQIWRDSTTVFSHSIQVNPRSWPSFNNLGILLERRGRIEQAARLYERALEHNDHFQLYRNLAGVYYRLNKKELALRTLQEGLKRYPKDFGLNLRISILYLNSNRRADAVRHFRIIKAHQPNDPRVLLLQRRLAKMIEGPAE